MTAYRDRVADVVAGTERDVLALWEHAPEDRFVPAAAATVARANAQVTTLADLALAAALAQQSGSPPDPLGLLPEEQHVDQGRLQHAFRAVLAADIASATTAAELARSRAARIARVARDEPAGTASAAMTRAMRERAVPGWRRVTDAKPCPICVQWADGVVRPPTVQMARHTGCGCVQEPVLG